MNRRNLCPLFLCIGTLMVLLYSRIEPLTYFSEAKSFSSQQVMLCSTSGQRRESLDSHSRLKTTIHLIRKIGCARILDLDWWPTSQCVSGPRHLSSEDWAPEFIIQSGSVRHKTPDEAVKHRSSQSVERFRSSAFSDRPWLAKEGTRRNGP